MEPAGASELVNHLCLRLLEVQISSTQASHPTDKERRLNWTSTIPWGPHTLELFPHYYDPGWPDDLQGHEDYLWPPLLEPFRDFVVGSERADRILKVKISHKSRAPGQPSHAIVLSKRLAALKVQDTIPTLSDLCQELGRERDYWRAASGHVADSAFFQAVAYTLSSEATPDSLGCFDEEWRTLTPTAFLNTRFYPQRCDDRAFVDDEDCLRSLLGSILHAILAPKDGRLRGKYKYFQCWPVKGKNVVSTREKYGITDQLHIAHYDVSSFTASFRNVWLYLLEVLAFVTIEKACLGTLVVCVEGHLVSVTLEEVLRLYFYLAYRVKVFDTVAQEDFISLGGMLGVAGINTASCVFFSSFLQMIAQALRADEVKFNPRAGGDDVFATFSSKDSHANNVAFRKVGGWITTYIGHLSEMKIQTVSFQWPAQGYLLSTNCFCKKRVLIRWTATGSGVVLHYQSQYSLPLYSILLQPNLRNHPTFEEQAASFFSSLDTSLPWVAEKEELITLFTRVFCAIHGPFRAECAGKKLNFFPDIPFVGKFSQKARFIMDNAVSPRLKTGELAIRTWDSMLTYLLVRRKLVAIDGPVEAWDTHYVTLPESLQLRFYRTSPRVYELRPINPILVALVTREFLRTAHCVQ